MKVEWKTEQFKEELKRAEHIEKALEQLETSQDRMKNTQSFEG